MKITQATRKVIKRSLGIKTNAPIKVIPGIAIDPRLVGQCYYQTNKSGDVIQHPSAYAAKGWSSIVYHPSTRAVEVGEDWIKIACRHIPSVHRKIKRRDFYAALVEEIGPYEAMRVLVNTVHAAKKGDRKPDIGPTTVRLWVEEFLQ